jgi:hypothetical protein
MGHPGISLLFLTKRPGTGSKIAFRIGPKSDDRCHDLGDILISLRRNVGCQPAFLPAEEI